MGQCNNCHNVTCPFHGQCRSEQGNYTCICPTRNTCPSVRVCFFFLLFNELDRIAVACVKSKHNLSNGKNLIE
jgi:hypothetical protein